MSFDKVSRMKFSRLSKNPQNPQKLEPLKFSGYIYSSIDTVLQYIVMVIITIDIMTFDCIIITIFYCNFGAGCEATKPYV